MESTELNQQVMVGDLAQPLKFYSIGIWTSHTFPLRCSIILLDKRSLDTRGSDAVIGKKCVSQTQALSYVPIWRNAYLLAISFSYVSWYSLCFNGLQIAPTAIESLWYLQAYFMYVFSISLGSCRKEPCVIFEKVNHIRTRDKMKEKIWNMTPPSRYCLKHARCDTPDPQAPL